MNAGAGDLEDVIARAARVDRAELVDLSPAQAFELGAELGSLLVVLLGRSTSPGASIEVRVRTSNAARAVSVAFELGASACLTRETVGQDRYRILRVTF